MDIFLQQVVNGLTLGCVYAVVALGYTMVYGIIQLINFAHGFGVMIGCMVASSLAMAPALLLAAKARFVDLDGPLLLARDRPDGLIYDGSLVHPPSPALWG
jgi:branched-subunit amino acid ABC-type transport system permease component